MLTTEVCSRVFELYVDDLCRTDILSLEEGENLKTKLSEGDLSFLEKYIDYKTSEGLAQRAPARSIAALRQLSGFFKKIDIFRKKEFCEGAAYEAFIKAEYECSLTNDRLDNGIHLSDPIIIRARHIIEDILGPFEDFYRNLKHYVKFSTGATSTLSRRSCSIPEKCRGPICATSGTIEHLEHLFGRRIRRAKITETNKIAFVPKSYKTDRTIACEPTHAMPFQLAFDSYAKHRLKRVGIDLSDQTLNQLAAFRGSLDNSLTTLDLSAASDTLSYNTVCALLPHDWFKFLCSIRSRFYRGKLQGKPFAGIYHKFSSMGNGGTFPLETLIFYALTKAVGATTCIVYGDDIILDSKATLPTIALLRFFGFKVNESKSFSEPHNFRESCGTDWYNGVNVTPIYIRHLPRKLSQKMPIEDKRKVVTFCNQLILINEVIFRPFITKLISFLKLPIGPRVQSMDTWVWSEDYRLLYAKDDIFKQAPYAYGYKTVTKPLYVRQSLVYVYALMSQATPNSDFGLQSKTIIKGVKRCRVRVYWHDLL